jgi:NitT/TauT family transport system substrate-binding protein
VTRIKVWLALMIGGTLLPTAVLAVDSLKVSLNFFPYGQHVGFFVARDLGFYREGGQEVEILKGEGSADTVLRVGTGAADFGFADFGTMVVGRSRGLKLKSLAIIMDKDPSAFFSLKGAAVRTPKELEGKTVGAASASAVREAWPALATVNGVDLAKVTWVDMPGPAYVASLLSRKVDTIATFLTTLPSFEMQAKKQGDEIFVMSFAEFGVDAYGAQVFATEALISSRPAMVRHFVQASLRGFIYAIENPDEAVRIFRKDYPESDPVRLRQEITILASLMVTPRSTKQGIGSFDEAKVIRSRNLALRSRNVDPNTMPPQDCFTPDFLPKLFPKSKS